jgi:CubicO group peptidase (beta-lactamase class C family)
MILQERELLSVHDPISTYVLDCPEAWKAITIHHLLTHTSGIPDFVIRTKGRVVGEAG